MRSPFSIPIYVLKNPARLAFVLLIRLLAMPGALAAAQRAKRPLPKNSRILLLRPDYLGDLVLTTPIFHALKAAVPEAHITMMVGPWSAELVKHHPDVDEVLIFQFPNTRRTKSNIIASYLLMLRLAKQLRTRQYDLVINLRHNYGWGEALTYLAAIPRRIGFAIKPNTWRPFLTETLSSQPNEHLTVSALRLTSAALQSLGYPSLAQPYTPEHYPLYFRPTEEEQQWITQRLQVEGISPSTPMVVIHPGTSVAVKLWRSEGWATCATELARKSLGSASLRIILTGSKSERALLEEIAQKTTVPITLIDDMTIGQLAALLQRAQLVLGVDSGPLHMAVTQGTRTVRIFGPTDPAKCGPWASHNLHTVIASAHRCTSCRFIPCGRLRFKPEDLETHPCTRLVPEDEVLKAVFKQLSLLAQSESFC